MPGSSTPRSGSRRRSAAAEAEFSTIEVRVGLLPGKIHNIMLNGGRKVSDALEGAELSADGYEIRVNAKIASASTGLAAGDTVLLVRKVKGNS